MTMPIFPPVLVAQGSFSGVTTTQQTAIVNTHGRKYALFLAQLSAITAGTVMFRVRGVGAYYSQDLYKTAALSATGFSSQSLGPGMQSATVLLPQMFLEADVVTGPASFTYELWLW